MKKLLTFVLLGVSLIFCGCAGGTLSGAATITLKKDREVVVCTNGTELICGSIFFLGHKCVIHCHLKRGVVHLSVNEVVQITWEEK